MKWIFILFSVFSVASGAETSDTITNKTNKEMLCVATYPSIYGEKEVNGQKRRVELQAKKEVIKTIQPNQAFKKERTGFLKCYNELSKVESFEKNNIQRTNQYSLRSHVSSHNKYDITLYEGKNREFVDRTVGIAQRCSPYKKGQYCNYGFGLDIIYDQKDNVKTVLFYDNTVKRGKLPFKPESIMQLYSNSEPLGLWVKKNYKKLFSKKPSVHTQNLIMWENLSKHIKRVIMTPQKGYFELSHTMKNGHNLFRDGWKDSKKAQEYVQAIEIQYQ